MRLRGYCIEDFSVEGSVSTMRKDIKTVESFLKRKYSHLIWKKKGPSKTKDEDVYVATLRAEDRRIGRGAEHVLDFQMSPLKRYVHVKVYYISPSTRKRNLFYEGKMSSLLHGLERHMRYVSI